MQAVVSKLSGKLFMELDMQNSAVVVTGLPKLPKTGQAGPAEAAGLCVGDVVAEVAGKTTAGLSLSAVASLFAHGKCVDVPVKVRRKAALSAVAVGGAPQLWEEVLDPATDRTYFHCRATRQSLWGKPAGPGLRITMLPKANAGTAAAATIAQKIQQQEQEQQQQQKLQEQLHHPQQHDLAHLQQVRQQQALEAQHYTQAHQAQQAHNQQELQRKQLAQQQRLRRRLQLQQKKLAATESKKRAVMGIGVSAATSAASPSTATVTEVECQLPSLEATSELILAEAPAQLPFHSSSAAATQVFVQAAPSTGMANSPALALCTGDVIVGIGGKLALGWPVRQVMNLIISAAAQGLTVRVRRVLRTGLKRMFMPSAFEHAVASEVKRRCGGGLHANNDVGARHQPLWLDTPVDADYLLGEHSSTLCALTRPAVVALYDPSSCLRGGICGPPALPVLLRPLACQPLVSPHALGCSPGPRLPTELETEQTVAGMGGRSGNAAFPHYAAFPTAGPFGGSFDPLYAYAYANAALDEGAHDLSFVQERAVEDDDVDLFLRVDEESTDDVLNTDDEDEDEDGYASCCL